VWRLAYELGQQLCAFAAATGLYLILRVVAQPFDQLAPEPARRTRPKTQREVGDNPAAEMAGGVLRNGDGLGLPPFIESADWRERLGDRVLAGAAR
jgi:hypothetical protein